jgi:hypothetical protein
MLKPYSSRLVVNLPSVEMQLIKFMEKVVFFLEGNKRKTASRCELCGSRPAHARRGSYPDCLRSAVRHTARANPFIQGMLPGNLLNREIDLGFAKLTIRKLDADEAEKLIAEFRKTVPPPISSFEGETLSPSNLMRMFGFFPGRHVN